MESILTPLLRSPQLPVYYRQLGQLLSLEQKKRKQFYDSLTEDQKAEFINGEVIVQTPVKMEHDAVSNRLNILLHTFVSAHDLGYAAHEKLLVSLTRNDYEPDVCFWNKETATTFQSKQVHFPAPDFIAEVISPATESVDRNIKFEDYAAHGVREYWIVDAEKQVVEQYILAGESYMLVQKTNSGRLESHAVPGFDLPAQALFDRQAHLVALRGMIASTR
ncbi:MAG: Uma2 family endonuclease [Chloroflexi bacterium]|nr:Uma2 family endonuclease [Chloroflexota bacterium]